MTRLFLECLLGVLLVASVIDVVDLVHHVHALSRQAAMVLFAWAK